MKIANALLLLALMSYGASAGELHVSVKGNDKNDGSRSKPFRTISAAAQVAQPGDAITVHEGTYRERVTPPRGGVCYLSVPLYSGMSLSRAIVAAATGDRSRPTPSDNLGGIARFPVIALPGKMDSLISLRLGGSASWR